MSKTLKLRNYRPHDKAVEKGAVVIAKAAPISADAQIAGILALAKQTASVRALKAVLKHILHFISEFEMVSLFLY